MDHRWSGWPGAYCLECGAEDQREICLADSCKYGWKLCPKDRCEECSFTGMLPAECPIHVNKPCLGPLHENFDT